MALNPSDSHELFKTSELETAIYCHTAHMMKIDNGVKENFQGKDPEMGLAIIWNWAIFHRL